MHRSYSLLLALAACAAPAFSQPITVPPMPANLQAPAGHTAYLKGNAVGTQNYVCLPGASGLTWRFQGPQATIFATVKLFGQEFTQQTMTHYLSPNPVEGGTPRAAWQSSFDSSAAWARKIAESSDPAFVAPNSIPWFLLQVVGTKLGPMKGNMLAQATYIQRINTSGGFVAANTACAEAGTLLFVPYTTDYIFYRAAQ